MVNENQSAVAGRIKSKRFRITSEAPLGKGAWGEVYAGTDTELGTPNAIKVFSPTELAERQMEERGLDASSAMKKEAFEFGSCTHIVPRRYEVDDSGTPFIVMPRYSRSLADVLYEGSTYPYSVSNQQISKQEALRMACDISKGVAQHHSQLQRVHYDIKPDNFLVTDSGEIHLNDLGTSTVVSWSPANHRRDNRGCIYTRASECYSDGSSPTFRSDVFAESALIYRIFTGKYPLEDEINNSKDPKVLMEQLRADRIGDKILRRKVRKNIPLELQGLLIKGLAFDPYKRFENGEDFKDELDSIMRNRTVLGALKKHATSTLKWLGAATALGGFIYAASTHQPTEYEMPRIHYKGEVSVGNPIKNERIVFEQESVPYPEVDKFSMSPPGIGLINNVEDNVYVAHLMRAYMWATNHRVAEDVTENQKNIYSTTIAMSGNGMDPRRVPYHIEAPTAAIKVALNESITPSGTVDLEDVCTIARVGLSKLNEARRASGSFDYAKYINAVGRDGKLIIPQEEREFIDYWRAYVNCSH